VQVELFLRPPIEGVVLQTYGTGNGPSARTDIITAFREATERGVIIVNITQCLMGSVTTSYATGKVNTLDFQVYATVKVNWDV
jgi:lysophospholipase